jgi:hypothetical protein
MVTFNTIILRTPTGLLKILEIVSCQQLLHDVSYGKIFAVLNIAAVYKKKIQTDAYGCIAQTVFNGGSLFIKESLPRICSFVKAFIDKCQKLFWSYLFRFLLY